MFRQVISLGSMGILGRTILLINMGVVSSQGARRHQELMMKSSILPRNPNLTGWLARLLSPSPSYFFKFIFSPWSVLLPSWSSQLANCICLLVFKFLLFWDPLLKCLIINISLGIKAAQVLSMWRCFSITSVHTLLSLCQTPVAFTACPVCKALGHLHVLFNQVKHKYLSCFVSKTINAWRVRINVLLASGRNSMLLLRTEAPTQWS